MTKLVNPARWKWTHDLWIPNTSDPYLSKIWWWYPVEVNFRGTVENILQSLNAQRYKWVIAQSWLDRRVNPYSKMTCKYTNEILCKKVLRHTLSSYDALISSKKQIKSTKMKQVVINNLNIVSISYADHRDFILKFQFIPHSEPLEFSF